MPKQPSYRVPVGPDHKTSYFNKDALLGALLFGFSFFGLGAIVGGVLGKRHQQHQADVGKVVKPPSVWNKDLLIGGLMGSNLAVLPYAVAAFIGVSAAAPLLVAGAVAILPLTVIGAFIGARRGKNKMAREYAEVETYVAQNGQFNAQPDSSPSASLSPAIAREVTPQQPSARIAQASQQISSTELQPLNDHARQGNQMVAQAVRSQQPEGKFTQREQERTTRVPVSTARAIT